MEQEITSKRPILVDDMSKASPVDAASLAIELFAPNVRVPIRAP
jgi:hypothetical protein